MMVFYTVILFAGLALVLLCHSKLQAWREPRCVRKEVATTCGLMLSFAFAMALTSRIMYTCAKVLGQQLVENDLSSPPLGAVFAAGTLFLMWHISFPIIKVTFFGLNWPDRVETWLHSKYPWSKEH